MKWFWQKASPAPSGECRHLWTNWSEPNECRVKTWGFGMGSDQAERDGWAQDRHCLNCNIYERRLA